MKPLLGLILSLFLFLAAPVTATFHPLMRSVFPLAEVTTNEDGSFSVQNVCTMFSINNPKHYFMTAGHCVVDENGKPVGTLYADEEFQVPVTVKALNLTTDLAVVWANLPAESLRLRPTPLEFEDPVRIPSFQLGQWTFMLTRGEVTNPDVQPRGAHKPYLLHSAYACGGASGSPILDEGDRVVSVDQIAVRFLEPCGGVGGGATFKQMQAFKEWFE